MESLLGRTIDNYEIKEVIARGGMGVVFKAIDTNLEKVVAIKMIDPFLARDVNFVKRFKTEAKALAKLENPGIVIVHALRETPEGLFMVMEYVESKSLSTMLKETDHLSIQQTISITEQLLDALAHAHNAGVIHRDIKPGNILVQENGRVKITDFGLAKVAQQLGGPNTVTQSVAGTLYYMSPEQIKGLKNVDSRSDIYSLGITVYEMLAGRIPFDKTESDFTIQKHIVEGDIPSPHKFNSGIPKKLIKIVNKAIDKDPAKRYQTAEEMLQDIKSFKTESAEVKEKKPLPVKFILSAVSVVLVFAAVSYFLFIAEGKPDRKYFLTLDTAPPGASVMLNEEFIGNTPLNEYELPEPGEIRLSLSKEGFDPIDTLVMAEDSINIFRFGMMRKVEKRIPPADHTASTGNQTPDNTAAAKTGAFSITSEPPGATVFLNGEEVGSTPFQNNSLSAGTYKLLLKKEGYRNISESVKYTAKDALNLSRKMLPAANLTVRSDPSGALVMINNKQAGKTTYMTDQLAPGDYTIAVTKPGYKPYSEKVKLVQNEPKIISKKLEQVNGRVEISLRPSGSIYIDEQLKSGNSPLSMELPGGSHRLKVVHPSLGTYEKELMISEEKTYNISIDLNRVFKLTVVSNPGNCEIYINGSTTGKYTPSQIKLTPGNYKVQIRKEGYESSAEITFQIPASIYEDQKDREQRQEFTLTKK